MAAEYVADTMTAVVGQWAGHHLNKTNSGKKLRASGMANRLDAPRGFLCDLIEWEWFTPAVRPAPGAVPTGVGPRRARPQPAHHRRRGLGQAHGRRTHVQPEDLAEYGSPAAREAGSLQTGDAPGCGPWTCLHDEPVTADAGRWRW
ncbi:hypothetical protein, partial [Micromonospora sp. KC723]|uniref:hypothetical protein n=1 Tax=Micromonospora sp. KC723 TaxID=2530381 RepID=UPI001A9F4579